MSQINTNGIDADYPVPGENNSTQGFRDNFSRIKTNLNTAGVEITDLQNKVVLKNPLDGTSLDNNMGNSLISNASVKNFRHTTFNLGSSLSGTVVVDTTAADVQFGTITGNTILQFAKWTPTNTERNLKLKLTFSNTDAVLQFPSTVISTNDNFGVTLLENYTDVNGVATITAPATSNVVELNFSTVDCGESVTVSPVNKPYKSTQIFERLVPPTGLPGDKNGAIAVDESVSQVIATETIASGNIITVSTTEDFFIDMPVTFTGNVFGNVDVDTTYHVLTIGSPTTFTISETPGGSPVALDDDTGNMKVNPASYLYVCTDDFNSTVFEKTVSATSSTGNVVTLNNTTSLVVDAPIVFSGDMDTANSNIKSDQVYYIKTVDSPNITISQSRFSGVAGSVLELGNSSPAGANVKAYVGNDIWKKVNLTSW